MTASNRTQIPETIDLSLSGGGFRATLFHLGVILYLVGRGDFPKVKRIFAVSGGAILGAHLLQSNSVYDKGTLDTAELGKAVGQFIRPIIRGNFRDMVIVYSALIWLPVYLLSTASAWLLISTDPPWPDLYCVVSGMLGTVICGVIAKQLLRYPLTTRVSERLYCGKFPFFGRSAFQFNHTWENLRDRRLDVRLLATDMQNAGLGVFSKHGFALYYQEKEEQQDKDDQYNVVWKVKKTTRACDASISQGVAASAAFPPLYPPLRLHFDDLTCQLTDGGVYDNLGVTAQSVIERIEPGTLPENPCVICDAGGEFVKTDELGVFNWMILRNIRATEIVMSRLAMHDAGTVKNSIGAPLCSSDHPRKSSIPNVSRDVSRIRTDLNRFSKVEAAALIRHGIDVAASRFGDLGKTEADQIQSVLNAALGEDSMKDIPAGSLKSSHRMRVSATLLWIAVPYFLLACTVVYVMGQLSERVVSTLANLVKPRMCLAEDVEIREFKQAAAWVGLDDEVALPGKPIVVSGATVGHYRSHWICGVGHRRQLRIETGQARMGISESEFVLAVHFGDERAIFEVDATSQGSGRVEVTIPPFRGFGRLWLICPKGASSFDACWIQLQGESGGER